MIEIVSIISKINTILNGIGLANMVIAEASKVTYTINLISTVLPILDEVSEIDLEEI